jgi:hypothetical protein
MAKADIYQVVSSFVTTIKGTEVEYQAGEIVDGDDPALRKMPEYFGPVQFKHRASDRPVEQATAAPGEHRGKAMTMAGMRGR